MESIFRVTDSKCVLCNEQSAKYSCPTCAISYCSIRCYRSHNRACTDSFYQRQLKEYVGNNRKSAADIAGTLRSVTNSMSLHDPKHVEPVKENIHDSELVKKMDALRLSINGDKETVELFSSLRKEHQEEFLISVLRKNMSEFVRPFQPWWKHTLSEHQLSVSEVSSHSSVSDINDSTREDDSEDEDGDLKVDSDLKLPCFLTLTSDKDPKYVPLRDLLPPKKASDSDPSTNSQRVKEMRKPSPFLFNNIIEIIFVYCFVSRRCMGHWEDLLDRNIFSLLLFSRSLVRFPLQDKLNASVFTFLGPQEGNTKSTSSTREVYLVDLQPSNGYNYETPEDACAYLLSLNLEADDYNEQVGSANAGETIVGDHDCGEDSEYEGSLFNISSLKKPQMLSAGVHLNANIQLLLDVVDILAVPHYVIDALAHAHSVLSRFLAYLDGLGSELHSNPVAIYRFPRQTLFLAERKLFFLVCWARDRLTDAVRSDIDRIAEGLENHLEHLAEVRNSVIDLVKSRIEVMEGIEVQGATSGGEAIAESSVFSQLKSSRAKKSKVKSVFNVRVL